MTIYLVKEGDSGNPASWPGPSRFRPLTREGRRQAHALVACLEGRPVTKILTGTSLRCRETVIPLADARDLEIESTPILDEPANVARAFDLALGAAAGPLLVCACASLVDAIVGKLYVDGWIDEDRADLGEGLVWLVEDAVLQGA